MASRCHRVGGYRGSSFAVLPNMPPGLLGCDILPRGRGLVASYVRDGRPRAPKRAAYRRYLRWYTGWPHLRIRHCHRQGECGTRLADDVRCFHPVFSPFRAVGRRPVGRGSRYAVWLDGYIRSRPHDVGLPTVTPDRLLCGAGRAAAGPRRNTLFVGIGVPAGSVCRGDRIGTLGARRGGAGRRSPGSRPRYVAIASPVPVAYLAPGGGWRGARAVAGVRQPWRRCVERSSTGYAIR